jgi:excisionase family DNA binding protein
MANDYEILTMKEICDLLKIHPSTIYKLVKQGEIPAFRIGSEWRFRRDTILRLLSERSNVSHEKKSQ